VTGPRILNSDWNFWPDQLAPAAIWATCAELGFDGLELGVYDPDVELSPDRVADAAALARRHDLPVWAALFSMPSTRWPEGALASPEHRRRAVNAAIETGHRAAGLGASVLGVWPGADPPTARDGDGWARTADSLAAIAAGLAADGLVVAVEAKPGQAVATTADAVRMCEEVGEGNLGVLLDTAHALAGGEHLEQLPAEAGAHLVHVHLGDSVGGDVDADLPPGVAHDFGSFLAALDGAAYAGALSFDLYGAVGGGGYTGEAASRAGLEHIRRVRPALP